MTTRSIIVPVIMCGGAGTRLWPLSTKDNPKQLHALTGALTLLQQTVLRCPQTRGFAAPILVCAERHADQVLAQCEAVNTTPAAIITEPCPRNTAPCAISAALAVQAQFGDSAQVLLLAADHYIADTKGFVETVQLGARAAAKGHIVTFGAAPTVPATGYGYLQKGTALMPGIFTVSAFVEKPDEETAKAYLKSGDYVWNAGIFLFSAAVMLSEMEKYRPDILKAAAQAWEKAGQDKVYQYLDAEAFAACPSESVDYAVMEKTQCAVVVPLDVGWSDVGAWPAIYDLAKKDKNGNACHGSVVTQSTQGTLLYADKDGPMIAALGIKNLAIITTSKAVLVAPLDQAEQIKALIEKLDDEQR
ncbi:MAG: mannose-1-phosphate guanylyltransferase/mannose-6-phosphate isomerase [Robiginitomaculum sp.]|nr:MAG: mannose-1-phosphate guanylyltransferase/mannose-6-phosphate isomerase [Robiginitomaculum sp.]